MALWDSHDGQAALDKADDVRKLHRLLQGLTLRQRRLLRLAFWEGLSRHEIGERLNVSHLAARRMLRRTLARLYWSWVCGSPEVKQSIVQEAV
jgi:RNA polymerase sigma factor (sigma-70 family)